MLNRHAHATAALRSAPQVQRGRIGSAPTVAQVCRGSKVQAVLPPAGACRAGCSAGHHRPRRRDRFSRTVSGAGFVGSPQRWPGRPRRRSPRSGHSPAVLASRVSALPGSDRPPPACPACSRRPIPGMPRWHLSAARARSGWRQWHPGSETWVDSDLAMSSQHHGLYARASRPAAAVARSSSASVVTGRRSSASGRIDAPGEGFRPVQVRPWSIRCASTPPAAIHQGLQILDQHPQHPTRGVTGGSR